MYKSELYQISHDQHIYECLFFEFWIPVPRIFYSHDNNFLGSIFG